MPRGEGETTAPTCSHSPPSKTRRTRRTHTARAHTLTKRARALRREGWTGLILAAQNGREAVVQLLLERGAEVNKAGKVRGWYNPLGLVGKAKAGSSRLTWTVWVQFPPFPQRILPALLMSSIN